MQFLRKALERGINPANIASWLCLQWLDRIGTISGTMRLAIKARLLGVRLGRGVRANGPVCIMRWPGGNIAIGDKVSIISSWRRATACALAFPARLRVFGPGASIEIGDGSQLSGTSITARSKKIRLGQQVLVGPNCVITDSDFHEPWPPEQRATVPGYDHDAPVDIGDYVWIGMHSIILKGVSIGSGAIIGAGSVVTRDVPPNCVACGVPALVVGKAQPPEGNEIQ